MHLLKGMTLIMIKIEFHQCREAGHVYQSLHRRGIKVCRGLLILHLLKIKEYMFLQKIFLNQ